MSTVEQVTTAVTAAAVTIPLPQLAEAMPRIEHLQETLSTLGEGSPALQEVAATLGLARRHLVRAVGALGIAKDELLAYTTDIGSSEAAANYAITFPPELAAAPLMFTDDTRAEQLAQAEEICSIGAEHFRIRHPAILRDVVKRQGEAIGEALRTSQRDRALGILEYLVRFNHGSDTVNGDYQRTGEALMTWKCSRELTALATQTDNPLLAARVTNLLFDAHSLPHHNNHTRLFAPLLRDRFMSRLHTTLQRVEAFAAHSEYRTTRPETELRKLGRIAARILGSLHDGAQTDFARTLLGLHAQTSTREASAYIFDEVYANWPATSALLQECGITREDAEHAWEIGYAPVLATDPRPEEIRRNNFDMIVRLEQAARGSVAVLHNVLNIHNFERYPEQMLLDAYAAIANPPGSYYLYAVAGASKNSAFRDNHRLLLQIHNAGGTGIPLIPVEFFDEADIRRLRRTLRQQGWKEADHVLVHAHGNPTCITAGKIGHRHASRLVDIDTSAIKRPGKRGLGSLIKSIVKPGGSISLISCRTAKGGGDSIAGNVATATGLHTEAPDQVVVVQNITLVPDGRTGGHRPAVTYANLISTKTLSPVVFPAH